MGGCDSEQDLEWSVRGFDLQESVGSYEANQRGEDVSKGIEANARSAWDTKPERTY